MEPQNFPLQFRAKIIINDDARDFHDTINPSYTYSVANHHPCRNNSDNNLAFFLERAFFHRTFASSLRTKHLSDKTKK